MTKTKAEILSERLKKVVESFDAMKKSGIDEEILISWITYKTRMKINDVRKMLEATDEFYNKLLKESIIEGMEED